MEVSIDKETYDALRQRYNELRHGGGGGGDGDVPYDIKGYLTEIETDDIDAQYMNSRFEKYFKLLRQKGASAEAVKQAETELHKTFATLSQEDQKYANIFLHDIQRGDVAPQEGKTFRDYVSAYRAKAKDDQIHRFAHAFGLDEEKLRKMTGLVNEGDINQNGRFDDLKAGVDKQKAKAYFEATEHTTLPLFKVNAKADKLLRDFVITGGFDIPSEQSGG